MAHLRRHILSFSVGASYGMGKCHVPIGQGRICLDSLQGSCPHQSLILLVSDLYCDMYIAPLP